MNTCAECRFWERNDDPHPVCAGTGTCRLFSDDASLDGSQLPVVNKPDARAFLAPFAGADGAEFITLSDFGCVQFEPHSTLRDSEVPAAAGAHEPATT